MAKIENRPILRQDSEKTKKHFKNLNPQPLTYYIKLQKYDFAFIFSCYKTSEFFVKVNQFFEIPDFQLHPTLK